ncbi:MAG: hypothetical protein RMI49_02510 [Candidatus Caldarchaeum sp.]|nr:hypothetical protein [Candidatus Caldarchaeum sp.]
MSLQNVFDGLFSILPSSFTGFPVLILVVVGLALVFFGRKLAKALAFIVTGTAAALLAANFLPQYLGGPITLVAAIVSFIVGGLIGLFVLRIGIGIAFGVLGYFFTTSFGAELLVAVVVGVILFIVGYVLSDRILAAATALLGGLVLILALTALGFPSIVSLAVAAILAAAGLHVQMRQKG